MIIAVIILSALGIVLALFLYARKGGKESANNKVLEAENEAMATRPLTDADFLDRVHTLAKSKRKNRRKRNDT